MKKFLYLPAVILLVGLSCAVSLAQAGMALDLVPDDANPASPVMGDHLRFRSTITNTGATPIQGVVAWLSLVEVDAGNEQPVDLEDGSANKAVTGTSLESGQSLRVDWPVRLIKGGDYRVVVSVTDRVGRQVYTSPAVQFHVRQKRVLRSGRVVTVAAVVPMLIIAMAAYNRKRSA